jgi:hypothetical protein
VSVRAGIVFMRGVLISSVALLPSGCLSGALQEFGSSGCRTVYVLSGGVVQPVNSCGGIPRDGLMAQTSAGATGKDLVALLAAPKFEADAFYTGVDTPEDRAPLTKIVNDAVRDVIGMPEPRDAAGVRRRLALSLVSLDMFATEDREHALMYLVLAWRAAGFLSESGLAGVPDDQVLQAA